MQDRIMQCCYSNLKSENGSAGWQVAAASENLPRAVVDAYRKMQDSNVVSRMPVDASGNPLNVYELIADGRYVYVTRIQYGLEDAGGRRNNMLSHTYLFELDAETLADPNVYLTVSDQNFTGNIEQARQIRGSFERLNPYTVESALAACGMDEEYYQTLIYSMYAQKEARRTLQICGLQGESMLRPLLYCILRGLPYSMRRNFSCATAVINVNSVRTLIFSEKRPEQGYFFDIRTGENNILTERNVRKYKRWGYVDYFVHNRGRDGVDDFFERLENQAIRLGDSKGSDSQVLRIAYQILTCKEVPEGYEETRERLYELLLAPIPGSEDLDVYLYELLKRINDTGRVLDEEPDHLLLERLGQGQSTIREMPEELDRYLLNKILYQDANAGAALLAGLPVEKFEKFSRILMENEGGSVYLDAYYEAMVPGNLTWMSVREFVEKAADHCERLPQTARKLAEGVERLYRDQLKNGRDPLTAYQSYVEICLYSIDTIREATADEKVRRQELERQAADLFWEYYRLEDMSYPDSQLSDYPKLEGNEKYDIFCEILKIFRETEQNQQQACVEAVGVLMRRWGRKLSKSILEKLYQNLKKCIRETEDDEKSAQTWLMELSLVMETGSTRCIDDLDKYCNLISLEDSDSFVSRYEQDASRLDAKLRIKYASLLLGRLNTLNLIGDMSVDVLLSIGKSIYDSPFEILDKVDSDSTALKGIFDRDPDEIVQKSSLLLLEEYASYADRYIRSGGENRQTVKEWMAAVKKYNQTVKKNEKLEKKNEKLEQKNEKKLEKSEKKKDSSFNTISKKSTFNGVLRSQASEKSLSEDDIDGDMKIVDISAPEVRQDSGESTETVKDKMRGLFKFRKK